MNKSKCDDRNNVDEAGKVFAEYGNYIHAVIRFRIKDEALVEDLCHDFFLSLVNNPIPSDVRDMKRFIYRRLVADTIDEIRKITRYRAKLQGFSDHIKTSASSRKSVKNESRQLEDVFQAINNHLSKTEIKAMNHRFRDNCNVQETADRMGVKSRSVSRYVSVGIKKLKDILSEKGA